MLTVDRWFTHSMKLRLSITDHCSLRCWYCRPTAGVPDALSQESPPLDALGSGVAWLHRESGVTRVRLTGGEPLLHSGVERFVELLALPPGIEEVCLTTNGALLARHALPLKQAGLTRVNVSLDTLDSARFRALTGGGGPEADLGRYRRRLRGGVASAQAQRGPPA